MLKPLALLSAVAAVIAGAVAVPAEASPAFAPCPTTWAQAKALANGRRVIDDLSTPDVFWVIYDGRGDRVLGAPVEKLILHDGPGREPSMSFWFRKGTPVKDAVWRANGRECRPAPGGYCTGSLSLMFPGATFRPGDLIEVLPLEARDWSEVRCNYKR